MAHRLVFFWSFSEGVNATKDGTLQVSGMRSASLSKGASCHGRNLRHVPQDVLVRRRIPRVVRVLQRFADRTRYPCRETRKLGHDTVLEAAA